MSVKTYQVLIPLVGSILVEVEAENAELAEEKAFASDFTVNLKKDEDQTATGILDVELNELDLVRQVVRGNICYAPTREVSVDEVDW